ncbi:MAG: tetratricopeptide repeat-containing sensor histidine kinase [Bacteroidota bacterium]|nr:tetratricopeptide repeat-containing sensor histidine kinase [Bacteroidota bacterium]
MFKLKFLIPYFIYLAAIEIFCLGSVYAQESKIREAEKDLIIHTAEDSKRVDIYNKLSFYFHTVDADSTLFFANKALILSTKLGYKKGIADAYKHGAIGHYVKSEGDTAIKLNNLALKMYETLGDKKGEGAVINNIAIIYHNIGKYDEAIEMHQKGLEIRKMIGDSFGIAGSYNNIANCYTDKGDYVKSLQNLFNGLLIREQMNDKLAMANSYANIGGVYYRLQRLDEAYISAKKAYDIQMTLGDKEGLIQSIIALGAIWVDKKEYRQGLQYFFEAKTYAKELGNQNSEIVCQINIAEVYNKIRKHDSAMFYFQAALDNSIATGDFPSIAIANSGIGSTYNYLKQYKQGIIYLEKGYSQAKSYGIKQAEFESAKNLAEAYSKINNLAKSVFYYEQTLLLKDSLFSEENARKTHEISFNYLLEKKQNEIALLEKDKSIQEAENDWNKLVTFSLIFIIAALLLIAYVMNQYRLKEVSAKEVILNQKNEIEIQANNLEALNQVKNKTFSILSHDLKNPIASLTNVVELMDEEVLSESDFNLLRSSFRSQLKSLNILLDNTLNWAKSQMIGEVKPNKTTLKIHPLVRQNFELFKQNAQQKNIQLVNQVSEEIEALADKNHLDIVIRNILFNAIKFTKEGGQVLVQTEEDDTALNIQIIDTGVGMTDKQLERLFSKAQVQGNYGTSGETGAGIGLILSNDYIQLNGGKLSVRSELNKGTTFIITLPKTKNELPV